ncbi:MAG: signal recognition particle protein, partial [Proteobacteria bacterium]|nr:signal recognition particle protein [Pseudomonadota bacterium]
MFEQLGDRFKRTFKTLRGRGRLSEDNIQDALREVRIALLEADVALSVVKPFINQVRERAIGKEVIDSLSPGEAMVKVVHDELIELMGVHNDALDLNARPPVVILVAGLQGAGKTTTVAKLANLLRERDKKSVAVVSADVYRPAAIDQLKQVSVAAGAQFIESSSDQNPVRIARAAVDQAKKLNTDVLIIDTAGRLHVDQELMQEVKEIHAVSNPSETLFVVDSLTGQDAANSAKAFNEALELTGLILTKTDGDARGGAALSIRHITGKPVKFIGTGEGIDKLEAFYPDRIASRILGMGDVLSLVEEVERKVDKQKAQKLARKVTKGKGFDLDDFRDQLLQMEQMGGMSSMMDKLPGMGNIPQAALGQGEKQTRQIVAIINSMTPRERAFPAVIKATRKQRIAAGSGTRVQDINRLLKQFLQMQKMMKKMRGKGGMRKMMGMMKGMGGMG